MLTDEAKLLLGFPTNSCPTACQVKAAYRRKVWETHPDCFPVHLKPNAELKFKMISEAYTCLLSGARREGEHGVGYSRVVRRGVPRGGRGGRRNHALIGLPFLFIILGTAALGGTNIARSYRKQKADYPSHNPFLP
ncbi:chaperone protein dnaJ 72 isoform X1 [Capsicum annuum]|uniref:chaperone protein dnaJ 72 isoform X1 n=1 Tax=Capsicum annuum TaxID=4072 RepID=UPI0007BEDC33|nr:chaperone protein dnaJ 72 isoform X1 [Capsicum annuum]